MTNPKQINDFEIKIAEILHSARKESRRTREEVSEKIGISLQQLHKYEKGLNRISIGRFVSLCKVLKLAPGNILNKALED